MLLEARDVKKSYMSRRGRKDSHGGVAAVDLVSFGLYGGATLGIVGESGCGKSTLLRCLVRLETPDAGQILYRGADLSRSKERDLREFRRHVQWVPQNPYSSLDPRMLIRRVVAEPLIATGRRDDDGEVTAALNSVGLGPWAAQRYPHELSGGERQRAAIARALVVSPQLLVLDEPVSALDVSVRAEVLNLLQDLRTEYGLAYILVAHDLAVVLAVCDRVAVMYAGQFVEVASAEDISGAPAHPYTRALLSAVPIPDPRAERARERILLRGEPAPLSGATIGCRFRSRCPVYLEVLDAQAKTQCNEVAPTLQQAGGSSHTVACHYPD
jgi:oligopeptide transport system ATP-binding protein